MDKEQRAKEREKEGERAFYLLSSLSISFVVVVLFWCSLLQSSSPIERKRRGICYSTHHHGRRRSDLLWSSSFTSFTSFFFVFFFFFARAKKGKRLRILLSLRYLLLSLFSLFRWQNLILSSSLLFRLRLPLKNSDLFFLSPFVVVILSPNKKQKQR